MKLIIAGGRSYYLTPADFTRLDALHALTPVTLVVSGCATGADAGGIGWAKARGIPVDPHPYPSALGPAGGPIRNAAMAAVADAVVLFPGGKGTADMRRKAEAAGLAIHDWRSA